MEELITKSRGKIARVQKSFQRELLHQINWSSRLIALKGARGVGKTTLLLQAAAIKLSKADNALYVSMDDLFFQENTLYQLAKTHALTGGTHLFVDEVHKYPNWSRELKLIYDDFEEIKVVFTSSSILEIFQGESDLSRRAIAYTLFELSFREFIAFDQKTVIKPYSLDDILLHSAEIELEILPQLKPIPAFQDYLKYGAYPYFLEGKDVFAQRLTQVVNLIIEVDLNAVDNLTYDMIVKTKKLLAAIATSVPFTPNITKLCERTGISRPSLIKAISQLERARMVHQLFKPGKGIGQLTKPEKLYLNNPNLLHVLGHHNWEIGTARETFFVSQLSVSHKVNLAPKGDFMIDEKYTFEVGGENKTAKQIQGLPNAYLAKDNVEYTANNAIPLWLFGFLY
jgi:uncharacterized protein